MSWRELILSDLPDDPQGEPDGPDPLALRADILDELSDHLDCAMQRERLGVSDDSEARRRVLDRFGDPTQIARQLWLDAMKEIIMKNRIMLGTIIVLAAACVAIAATAWWSVRQNARQNEALVAQLQSMQDAMFKREEQDALGDWAKLQFKLVAPDEFLVSETIDVFLTGAALNAGEEIRLKETLSPDGVVTFGPVLPGSYKLSVRASRIGSMEKSFKIQLFPGTVTEESVELYMPQYDPQHVSLKVDPPTMLEKDVEIFGFTIQPKHEGSVSNDWTYSPSSISGMISKDGRVFTWPNRAEDWPLSEIEDGVYAIDENKIHWKESLTLNANLAHEIVADIMFLKLGGDNSGRYTQFSYKGLPAKWGEEATPAEVHLSIPIEKPNPRDRRTLSLRAALDSHLSYYEIELNRTAE